jgi:hypothetical protein
MKRKPLVLTLLAVGSAIILLGAIVYVASQPAADATSGLNSKMRPLIRAQVTVTDDQTGKSVTTSAPDSNGAPGPASIGYGALRNWQSFAFGTTPAFVPLGFTDPNSCNSPYQYNRKVDDCVLPPSATPPPSPSAVPTKSISYQIVHEIQASHVASSLTIWLNMTTDNPDPMLASQSLHYAINPDNSTTYLDGCQSCLLKSPQGNAATFQWRNVPVRCASCASPHTLSGTRFTVTLSVTGIDDQGRDVWGRAAAPFDLVLGAGSLDVQIHANPLSIMGLGYGPTGDARVWRDRLQPQTG